MHPLLARRRGLLLYLLAWTPILTLLAAIDWASGRMPALEAAAVLGPSCLVYAFVCLSPWYICRIRPLGVARLAGLAATWTTAALAASLVLVGVAWVTASVLSQIHPFETAEQKIRGDLPLLFGMGLLLYLLSAGLHYMALAAEQGREAERRAAEARALAREAQLQVLKMQINPHFLFNSLHSIAALATLDGGRAREMCIRLSDFLRSSLGLADRERIPLEDELALARNYLEVERVRFGDRLRVEEQIELGCRECLVPALLLQPLMENAVKHGIAGLVEGGSIRLAVSRAAAEVTVTVENAFDPDMPPPRKNGLGLAHVRRRLQASYGEAASLEAGSVGDAYRVVLRFPCELGIGVSPGLARLRRDGRPGGPPHRLAGVLVLNWRAGAEYARVDFGPFPGCSLRPADLRQTSGLCVRCCFYTGPGDRCYHCRLQHRRCGASPSAAIQGPRPAGRGLDHQHSRKRPGQTICDLRGLRGVPSWRADPGKRRSRHMGNGCGPYTDRIRAGAPGADHSGHRIVLRNPWRSRSSGPYLPH